ncbi:MAG: hypothetical protein KDA44_09790 [Planctomycetales bacterium]|nr:hypothetical protein [Planctomycetales bacterium]
MAMVFACALAAYGCSSSNTKSGGGNHAIDKFLGQYVQVYFETLGDQGVNPDDVVARQIIVTTDNVTVIPKIEAGRADFPVLRFVPSGGKSIVIVCDGPDSSEEKPFRIEAIGGGIYAIHAIIEPDWEETADPFQLPLGHFEKSTGPENH